MSGGSKASVGVGRGAAFSRAAHRQPLLPELLLLHKLLFSPAPLLLPTQGQPLVEGSHQALLRLLLRRLASTPFPLTLFPLPAHKSDARQGPHSARQVSLPPSCLIPRGWMITAHLSACSCHCRLCSSSVSLFIRISCSASCRSCRIASHCACSSALSLSRAADSLALAKACTPHQTTAQCSHGHTSHRPRTTTYLPCPVPELLPVALRGPEDGLPLHPGELVGAEPALVGLDLLHAHLHTAQSTARSLTHWPSLPKLDKLCPYQWKS